MKQLFETCNDFVRSTFDQRFTGIDLRSAFNLKHGLDCNVNLASSELAHKHGLDCNSNFGLNDLALNLLPQGFHLLLQGLQTSLLILNLQLDTLLLVPFIERRNDYNSYHW
jgi:hypothetical protein